MSYRPITDVWVLVRPKVKYYGAYPAGFLERARALLGVAIYDPVLHVCGGKVRDYPYPKRAVGPNDATIDLDPACEPDYLMDVRKLGVGKGDLFPYRYPHPSGPVDPRSEGGAMVIETPDGVAVQALWPAALVDRPYTPEDAANYAVGADVLPDPNDLLKRALSVVRPGGRVGFLDYYVPRPPKKVGEDEVKFVALVGVSVGFGNRMRAFSVFERVAINDPNVPRCPSCGSDQLEEQGESGTFWMHCHACGADGADLPVPEIMSEPAPVAGNVPAEAQVEAQSGPVEPSSETAVPTETQEERNARAQNLRGAAREELRNSNCATCDQPMGQYPATYDGRPMHTICWEVAPTPGDEDALLCRECWGNRPLPPPDLIPHEGARCDDCSNKTTLMRVGDVLHYIHRPHEPVEPLVEPTPEQHAVVHNVINEAEERRQVSADAALDGF